MEEKNCRCCGRIIKYPEYDCPICDEYKHSKMTLSQYEGLTDHDIDE